MASKNKCPTCGDEFDKESSMKKHHKIIHDKSIAGREFNCDYCGKTDRKSQHKLDKYDNNFCSTVCKYDYLSDNQSGENHHQYDRVSVECDHCGETTEKHPRTLQRGQDNYFCNMKCRNKYYRDGNLPTGKDHPSWNGGYDKNYGSTWRRKRQEIVELDNYNCQECGESQIQLHVHHIKPIRTFDNVNDAHYKENLVTLCCNCHPNIESLERDEQIERLNVPRLEL